MGLYKLRSHKSRLRDRCDHAWWGSFRGVRVSLSKWANRDVKLKTDAQAVLADVRAAIRAGTFNPRGQVVREITPMTFREFAEIYKERHAVAKGLSLARRPHLNRAPSRRPGVAAPRRRRRTEGRLDAGVQRRDWRPSPHWHDTWLRTVLKAYGVKPKWSARLKYRGHSAESKAAYHRIDLRWHDLRHEYASRLVEQGVPLAQVRDLLGHASITTTERYDNQKLENLQVAVTKLERGLAFSAEAASWTPAEPPVGRSEAVSARQPVTGLAVAPQASSPARLASDSLSSFFQESGSDTPTEPSDEALATKAHQLSELNLGDWLGGRDSVMLPASLW